MIDQKLTITITKIISITNSNRILKGTDNQPRDASTSTTAIGIINKYFADVQTSLMMEVQPLEFWYNSCPKAYSIQFRLLINWQHPTQSHRPFREAVLCLWNA